MQGASAGGASASGCSPLRRTSSGGASSDSISLSPPSVDERYACRGSSRASAGSSFDACLAAEQERVRAQFVSVLEAKGWGPA